MSTCPTTLFSSVVSCRVMAQSWISGRPAWCVLPRPTATQAYARAGAQDASRFCLLRQPKETCRTLSEASAFYERSRRGSLAGLVHPSTTVANNAPSPPAHRESPRRARLSPSDARLTVGQVGGRALRMCFGLVWCGLVSGNQKKGSPENRDCLFCSLSVGQTCPQSRS
jgi:hypothetical protein